MLSIAIIEDNSAFRQTIEDFLNAQDDYHVIFSGGRYQDFIESNCSNPDFILLDIHLPDAVGTDVLFDLRKIAPRSFIVMITGDSEKEFLLKGMENGANAFVYKPFKMTELDKVIRQVNETGSFLEPEILTKLLGLINEKKKMSNSIFREELTPREKDLLRLIMKGHTYKEMATLLNISFHTVNHHLKNLYLKTDVRSKSELLAKYFQN